MYDITVEADSEQLSSATLAKDIIWKQKNQYDAEVDYDGCYVLRTNCVDLSDDEI